MKKAERENKIKALWREVYGPPRFVVVGGPGILERLDKLETAAEQEWRKRNDRIFAAESRLEARLEKLEARTKIDRELICDLEDELARRSDEEEFRQSERYWFEGEWWVKYCHSGVVGRGDVVLDLAGKPYRWPNGDAKSVAGWTQLRREDADSRLSVARQPDEGERGATPKQPITGPSYQPDEPMADMPETCPDCDDEYPGECATCKPETGPSDEWVSPEEHRVVVAAVVAERDKLAKALENQRLAWEETLEEQVAVVRAERDKLGEFHRANVEGRVKAEAELDRLKEGMREISRYVLSGDECARLARALLDGDDE